MQSKPLFKKSLLCHTDSCCVEVAIQDDAVLVRQSQNPEEQIRFTHAEWSTFLQAVQTGKFSLSNGSKT